ncbi:Fic family protein [bacterium]|nr:Fic family protein [bacterium]
MTALLKEIDGLQKQINEKRPLEPKSLEMLRNYFKIGLTWSSNALEGNTLTESETKVVIEDGLTIGGRSLKDHYEAIGHAEAFDFLYNIVGNKIIIEKDIKKLHQLFYYRIDKTNAGAYRKLKVFISGTKFVPPAPEKVPELMQTFAKKIPEIQKEYHPIEFAALIHKEIVDIHPFVDGNGRTARLLMNLALLQAGYVVTIIPPIRRADYIASIVKSQVNPKDDTSFKRLIAEMVLESQKDYLRMLKI